MLILAMLALVAAIAMSIAAALAEREGAELWIAAALAFSASFLFAGAS